ncbi:MAG: alanine--tRNA ligase, partial [Acidobacteriota bacterium]|nr:alanine--tRNA ligase [Acidobacteriota bacterium]
LRHHTFFEMLGNFSFGDYFKQDAIELAWTLLTREWGLDPSRLYATVFNGEAGIPRDEEAYRRWRDFLPDDHIGELGLADNFWAMGETGPCGRCSEIYYDRGSQVPGTGRFIDDVDGGSERFVEIWNNVFMEFARDDRGGLAPLPAPSIDTGMGLERVAAVTQGTLSNYDTPLFTPVLEATAALTGRPYGRSMTPADVSMRVVADHLRAMTFLIADGVVPSNEWRGYVLRKIMRRAMRHGRKLGLHEPFLHGLVDVLVSEMGAAYPELGAGRDAIVKVVKSEEERFDAVLTSGLPRLEEALERASAGAGVLPGDEAFKLYDTYGLPRDFIEDLASNLGVGFDASGFDREMATQRQKARAKSGFDLRKGDEFHFSTAASRASLSTVGDLFEGYEQVRLQDVPVIAVFDEAKQQVEALTGRSGWVVLARTPFYVEAGGQVSDQGVLEWPGGTSRVSGVVRLGPGLPRVHRLESATATLRMGDLVTAATDEALRDATRRNHTATHLLHAVLRQVLGPHVKQAGSLVAPDRLRFDFVHLAPLTAVERLRIERQVNDAILRNEPVRTEVRDTQEAIAGGAMALFGEKYGDRVRVVAIGDGRFSTELCGGTHVRATGDIGAFLVTDESGVAAGVRRIEALTGLGALDYARLRLDEFERLRGYANAEVGDVLTRIEARVHGLEKALKDRDRQLAKAAVGASGGEGQRISIGDVTLVCRRVDGASKDLLRSIADQIKSTLTTGVVFLAGPTAEGKVAMVASVTGNVIDRLKAGQLVKELAPMVGGGGGGRPDFAEAGGKDPAHVDDMLQAAPDVVRRLLGG